jgi:protein-tyrosine-phosphatase
LLRARLDREGIDVEVRSAGLLTGGQPASPATVSVALEYGIDLSGHVSQTLGAELLGETDLVLGMSVEHVREVVALCPVLWPRAFTLKELVNRGGRIGRRVRDDPLPQWLCRASADREITDLLRTPNREDVADPIGATLAELRVLAKELDTLLGRVVDLAWTAHRNDCEREGPPSPVSTPPGSEQLGPRR